MPPVTHLRGITFDGTRFWLLRGDHNALEHTLVEWDPSSAQLLRSFTYENLIEVAGTGVYGLGWDGSTVWISVSGNTNKLVQVQPEDGAILRTLGSPSVLGPSDLEFFDGALWLSTGTGRAYRVDTSSQTVEFSFPVFEEIGRDSGIAVRSGELWVSGLFGGLRVYHPSTGALMGEVDVQSDFPLSALCFAEGQLVSVEERGIVFYGIEPLLTPEL